MTSRERLLATLQGRSVDRPAVNFYEIGGIVADTGDPDPYNIYNSPDWKPLIELAETKTDIIRMVSAVRERSFDPGVVGANPQVSDYFQETCADDGHRRVTRLTVTAGGRVMTQQTVRERELNTVWTTEHLLKSAEDVEAYLTLPREAFAETIDVSRLVAAESDLGDRGLVMVDTEDPLCAAAALFSMEDYTVLAFTERELFLRLLDTMAEFILPRTEEVSRRFPGRLWRIYGPEFASAPYLPPELFREYVVRYVSPMARAIQAHGGTVRIHSHGRLQGILPLIDEMGIDALDPIEPPPQGDVELREVRERYGRQWVLFGNLEVSDIESLSASVFAEKVKRALDEGMSGPGRGFVLMPSASPFGRQISPLCLKNYETMVELAVGALF